uniref:CW domain-containing protein n=2 Tax=Caenorhabditis japonica TaxID=281687 RepID=A0A8R1DPJ1_CAEJA
MSCGGKVLLVILSMYTSISSCDNLYKSMTLVWGYPQIINGKAEKIVSSSWDECVLKCYQEDSCTLVHKSSSGCDLYRFKTVVSARNPSHPYREDLIAFKTLLPTNTCPINPFINSSIYTYQDASLITYNTTITYSVDSNNDTIINFNYTTLKCPTGSKLFIRGIIPVCLSVQYFTNESTYKYCANLTRASALCKKSGGTLTGPANGAELQYFTNVSLTATKIAPYPDTSIRIWIDGDSVYVARQWIMEDPTHNGDAAYPYGSDAPNSIWPGSGLYLYFFPTSLVDDYLTTSDFLTMNGGLCWRGAACRLDMKIV